MEDGYCRKDTGLVEAIFIGEQKSAPRQKIEEGILKAGFGLVGDINSGKLNKHVVILGLEDRIQVEKHEKEGLCINRFHETIRTKNIELYKQDIGTKIKIGETIHEISYIGKKCFAECELFKKGNVCPLSSQIVFTKVVNGGTIKVGDFIQVL